MLQTQSNLFHRVMPWMQSPLSGGYRFQANRKIASARYRPEKSQLYPGTMWNFVFSFDGKFAPLVTTLGTQSYTWTVPYDYLVNAMTGVIVNSGDNAADFLFQISQNLGNVTQPTVRPWFSTPAPRAGILGNGQSPNYLKYPIAVAKGQQLTCEVKSDSMAATPSLIQVILFGSRIDES